MTNALHPSRRGVLVGGARALAMLAGIDAAIARRASDDERVVPWLDAPLVLPDRLLSIVGRDLNLLDWSSVDAWITPIEDFFELSHHGTPEIDARTWELEIGGLVERPAKHGYDALRALPRKDVVFAMECSGNSGLPWFEGAVGNARWGGTPLAPLLRAAAPREDAIEVVFFGADRGNVKSRYLDGDGWKLGDIDMEIEFARSMPLEDALHPDNLLCWEMNGEPLPRRHGHPVRLIAPGWYGVANVKWLSRIELWDTRFMGPFMSDRYVTVREEPRPGGEPVWTRSSVGRSRIKSMCARVTVRDGQRRVHGAAWGAPIERVELSIDGGAWRPATIDEGHGHDYAWKLWHYDWDDAAPGEHSVTSRAIDRDGDVQPAPGDWRIAGKHTYWESNGQITRTVRL